MAAEQPGVGFLRRALEQCVDDRRAGGARRRGDVAHVELPGEDLGQDELDAWCPAWRIPLGLRSAGCAGAAPPNPFHRTHASGTFVSSGKPARRLISSLRRWLVAAPSANQASISLGSSVSIKAGVGTRQPDALMTRMLCW